MDPHKSAPPPLPPFASVLKSPEVEDPVNLRVHRPLAYGFVALIYRTSMTPNQVTLLAMTVGVIAAACWVEGSRGAMLAGGILLWTSAILDGADGILARAKKMTSPAGRALDGLADLVVGFSTSVAAMWHIVSVSELPLPGVMLAGIVAIVCTVFQMNLYDLYKELYLRSTRIGSGGESHRAEDMAVVNSSESVRSGPWYVRLAMDFYVDYLHKQERFTARTNPFAHRLLRAQWPVSDQSAGVYRDYNRGPMRLWISISLAPHSYLFAIAGMLDLLLPYLVARLTLMNVLTLLALLLQRRASRATFEHYEAEGLITT